jgi:uncharacterized protein
MAQTDKLSAAKPRAAKPRADEPSPRCSVCGKPVDPARKPFCSKRCADVDLNRWLNGAYVIEGEADLSDEDAAD